MRVMYSLLQMGQQVFDGLVEWVVREMMQSFCSLQWAFVRSSQIDLKLNVILSITSPN